MCYGRRCTPCRPLTDLKSQNADKWSTAALSHVCILLLSFLNALSLTQLLCSKTNSHMLKHTTYDLSIYLHGQHHARLCTYSPSLFISFFLLLYLFIASLSASLTFSQLMLNSPYITPIAASTRDTHVDYSQGSYILPALSTIMNRIPVDKEFNGSQWTVALPLNPSLSWAGISGVSILLNDLSLSVVQWMSWGKAVSPLSNKSSPTPLPLSESGYWSHRGIMLEVV